MWFGQKKVEDRRFCLPPAMRVYAIGDIHGRLDLLEAAFRRIDADIAKAPASEIVEITLGDYVDRGPASRQVIDALIARQRRTNLISLKGNHEDLFLSCLSDQQLLETWLALGCVPTLASYGIKISHERDEDFIRDLAESLQKKIPPTHTDWLSNLPTSHSCGDFLFVHAGIRPGVPIKAQSDRDLMWIRNDFLDFDALFEKFVVHGHTPVMTPDMRHNRVNIDTGAYATNVLTCLRIEDDRLSFI